MYKSFILSLLPVSCYFSIFALFPLFRTAFVVPQPFSKSKGADFRLENAVASIVSEMVVLGLRMLWLLPFKKWQ